MAIRADWLLPHTAICLDHGHDLVPLWTEAHPVKRYDVAAKFRSIGAVILARSFDRPRRSGTAFELWVWARLRNGPRDSFLNRQPLHAAATFCRLLGYALLHRAEYGDDPDRADPPDQTLCQTGFDVARKGEAAIHTAFYDLTARAGAQEGPKAVFPFLYDHLSRDTLGDTDYDALRELLAEHLRKTWPLGPGDELMGSPVTVRILHSVRTAASETGVDPRRLRKLLCAAGLIDGSLPDNWAVFDASAAAPLIASIKKLVPAKTFARTFGIPRTQLDLLVADRCLEPALPGGGSRHSWDLADGRLFLDRLAATARSMVEEELGWESIANSARRLKLRPAMIVRAIFDKRLERVGKVSGCEGYSAIRVLHEDVVELFAPIRPNAQTIEEFAKSAGIGNPAILKRLILNGHTPATRLRNPSTKAMQDYISANDARQFHTKFATLRVLAKEASTSWQNVSAKLKHREVAAFAPQGESYRNIFLRSDIIV